MYKKGSQSWVKHLDFLFLDIVCLNISFFVAFIIQTRTVANPYAVEEYSRPIILLNLMTIVVSLLSDSFKNIIKRGIYLEFLSTTKQVLYILLLTVFYFFVFDNSIANNVRNTIYMTAAIFWLLSFGSRLLLKWFIRHKMKKGGKRSLLIVTTSNIADKVISTVLNNNFERYTIAGIVITDKDLTGKKFKGIPVVANEDNTADYVCNKWIDEVFIDVHKNKPFPDKLVKQFATMGITVHTRLANSTHFAAHKQFVEKINGYTVLTSTINFATSRQLLTKRIIDILAGLAGCLATGILFIFVAPAIYISSPGPIFFKQVRIGKNGKKFNMYKFRTMYTDAEDRKEELAAQNRIKDGMMFKVDYDNRIIGCKRLENGKIKKGIGGWLRELSIDEFPQFFNVLKGDMSLIGTRPPTVDEWEKYELHHRARLAIKPGITGMWQVSGRSKIVDFEKVVELDTDYISHWSLGLDIKILLKTVLVVFKREGSM